MSTKIKQLEEIGFTKEVAEDLCRMMTPRAIKDLIADAKDCEVRVKKAVEFYNDSYSKGLNDPYNLYKAWGDIVAGLSIARGWVYSHEELWGDKFFSKSCIKRNYRGAEEKYLYTHIYWPIVIDYFAGVKFALEDTIHRANLAMTFSRKVALNSFYGLGIFPECAETVVKLDEGTVHIKTDSIKVVFSPEYHVYIPKHAKRG